MKRINYYINKFLQLQHLDMPGIRIISHSLASWLCELLVFWCLWLVDFLGVLHCVTDGRGGGKTMRKGGGYFSTNCLPLLSSPPNQMQAVWYLCPVS